VSHSSSERIVPKPENKHFFIDPNRCIGCKSCVQACSECDTHKGHSMIHLEYVDRAESVQTVPVVCMHCDSPTCAEVCPADAIKRTADGVVQTARKPRCIACNNCVLACPFGVPKMNIEFELMMKCDMCYDRTSVGKQPMCTTVCPSRALHYGTLEEIEESRPRSQPTNYFRFGGQEIRTKVQMMVPRGTQAEYIDVVDAMSDGALGKRVTLNVLPSDDIMLENVYEPAGEGDLAS
jgi:Fe-S-cluster-containing dehydrogenase component